MSSNTILQYIKTNANGQILSSPPPEFLLLTASTFPGRSSVGDTAAKPISDLGFALVADTTAAAMRTTIGAGTATSPLTTKGDLWTYSAGDDRLAVGADGYTLTADSTQATGLAWKNLGENASLLLAVRTFNGQGSGGGVLSITAGAGLSGGTIFPGMSGTLAVIPDDASLLNAHRAYLPHQAIIPLTGVVAGQYGDGTHTAQVTVGMDGRILTITSVAITGAAPTGAAGGDLGGTYPNPTVTPENASLLNAHRAFVPHTSTPAGIAGGDLQGVYPNPTVVPENASLFLAHQCFGG